MSSSLWVFMVAAFGGIAVAIQAQMMGQLDRGMGTLESVFINYGSGGLLIGLVILFLRGGNLSVATTLPGYLFLVGLVGLVIVGSIGYSVPRIGMVAAFTVMIAVQFIVAALIDHFALLGAEVRPISISRLTGIGVILLGVWLALRN